MSSEISVPFSLDQYGNVQTTQDPNVQAMQHVKSLVATEPGERVQLPRYGVPTRGYVFKADVNKVSGELTRDITTQMAMWEPSIQVLNVIPSPNSSLGQCPVEVDFTENFTPASQLLSAVIQVGGTVVDQ